MHTPAIGKKVLFGCLGLVIGVSMVGAAQAACTQADLTGAWYGMGISGNIVGSYFDITNHCKIVINSTGAVVASSSVCLYSDWSGKGSSRVTGGRLTVASACTISGSIGICEPDGCTNILIKSAMMERDKSSFTLLGNSSSESGFHYVLNFVKR